MTDPIQGAEKWGLLVSISFVDADQQPPLLNTLNRIRHHEKQL